MVKNPSGNPKWIPAVIIPQNGSLSYLLKLLDDGRVWRCHVNFINASSAFPLLGDTPELELLGDNPELSPSSPTETSTVPEQ